MKMKIPKKCPACGSARIEVVGNTFYCKNCGYLNKKHFPIRTK